MSESATPTPQTVFVVAEGYREGRLRFGFTSEADAERYTEVLKAAGEDHDYPQKIQINNPDAFRYLKRTCWEVTITDHGATVTPPRETTVLQLPEVTDEILQDYSPHWASLRSYVSAQHAALIAEEFRRQKFPPVEVQS